jgi:hypothetical protein
VEAPDQTDSDGRPPTSQEGDDAMSIYEEFPRCVVTGPSDLEVFPAQRSREPREIYGAPHRIDNPLTEIANLVRALTYGEMIELAGAMWKAKGEAAITAETLPGILHAWATK